MTTREAMDIIMIRRGCLQRASGLEYGREDYGMVSREGYIKQTGTMCNLDCSNCDFCMDAAVALEAFDKVIIVMTEQVEKEEKDRVYEAFKEGGGWRNWQLKADAERTKTLTI